MKKLFLALMTLVIIASFVTKIDAFPIEGLVLHLSFDESTVDGDEVEDLSGKGNNGIINGGAELTEGKFGEALLFDGVDDFVEISLTPDITFTKGSSFSAQAWIKTEDEPTQNDGILGNYRQSTDALWMLSVNGDDAAKRGKPGFYLRDVGRANSASITSPDFLNDNQWHHLVGVRDQDAKKSRFYVDGKLIDEVDDQTDDINSGQSIWIGEHLNRFYQGAIDDVKVWNRVLTSGEVEKSGLGIQAINPSSKLTTSWGLLKTQY